MTDEATRPEAQQPDPSPEPHTAPGQPPDDGGQDQPTPLSEGKDTAALRREAAGYRRKLREAEGTNERLAERVAEMQKANIEAQVSGPGKLADPADLWLTVKLDDLLAEDGAIDPEKVKAKLDQVLAEHPAWKDKTHPGLGGGARGTQPTAPSFGEALKNPSLRRSSR